MRSTKRCERRESKMLTCWKQKRQYTGEQGRTTQNKQKENRRRGTEEKQKGAVQKQANGKEQEKGKRELEKPKTGRRSKNVLAVEQQARSGAVLPPRPNKQGGYLRLATALLTAGVRACICPRHQTPIYSSFTCVSLLCHRKQYMATMYGGSQH